MPLRQAPAHPEDGVGAEAEEIAYEDADERGHGSGAYEDAHHAAADASKIRHLAHAHHGGNHHHQYERHDDHLQQVDVAQGHYVGPGEGFFHGGIAAAVEELQGKAVARP